ncbi:hypothetical protein SFC88_09590 [Nocardioides sp. HM23]|jgi:hypothetical protein|uniref:hypothetical protein n=1 Tax=Nocardioides bizhenqiangii TaxID=3095076 RepID=UPI002ACAD78D|nr:hypothetical protein [Nocardioides sp. HM23]MDZ5621079.1 hypothetical protein [Nocardioides sp. HM23]
MDQTYDDLLVWAYLGEVWGERMLERLLQDGTFADEREHLQLLLALESRTRQTLEAVISSRALDVSLEDARQEADAYAKGLAQTQDWEAFMRETLEIAMTALPDFEKLRDLDAGPAVEALIETVEHEKAVLAYARSRLARRPREAAEAVSVHLAKWAPHSAAAPGAAG